MDNTQNVMVKVTKDENVEMKEMAIKLYEEGIILKPNRHQFMLYAIRSVMKIVRRPDNKIVGTGNEKGQESDGIQFSESESEQSDGHIGFDDIVGESGEFPEESPKKIDFDEGFEDFYE